MSLCFQVFIGLIQLLTGHRIGRTVAQISVFQIGYLRAIWAFEGDCIFYSSVIFHAVFIQLCDILSVLSDFPFQLVIFILTRRLFIIDFSFQRGVSFCARIGFRLDCICYVFYVFLGRDISPREALAVDAISFDSIGFYVRKLGNRAIAITHNVSIFYSNTINASSSPISIRNIGGLLLQIFNSRILFTSCCF